MWSLKESTVKASAGWPRQVCFKEKLTFLEAVALLGMVRGMWAHDSTAKLPSMAFLDLELSGPLAISLSGHRTE